MLGFVLSMHFNLLNVYNTIRHYYFQPQFADYEIWRINTLLNITQITGSRPRFELKQSVSQGITQCSQLPSLEQRTYFSMFVAGRIMKQSK